MIVVIQYFGRFLIGLLSYHTRVIFLHVLTIQLTFNVNNNGLELNPIRQRRDQTRVKKMQQSSAAVSTIVCYHYPVVFTTESIFAKKWFELV